MFNLRNLATKADTFFKSTVGKFGAAGTAMVASGAAMASPGGAIAAELAGGKADVMLVIAAAAVIIGVLVLWSYIKRAK